MTPPVTTRRPSAAMPLAYPLGAGQPSGCRVCGPAAEGPSLAIGNTAKIGPLVVLTNFSPSRLPSLRATGSRECAPDDRLREAIQLCSKKAGLLRRFAPRNDG